uniref:Sm domain-containing protein n=1 Tax=Biomphalaria glabrata TaxID=6526 RepID=A0A2C9JWY6_BIOGL
MAVESGRSRFYFYNTMTCLLKALEGKTITVEIRNDKTVTGHLYFVERDMNLSMTNVVYSDTKGKKSSFSEFYVRGRQIRFVIIPDEVDIIKAMQWQIDRGEYYKGKERSVMQQNFQRKQNRQANQAAKQYRQSQKKL